MSALSSGQSVKILARLHGLGLPKDKQIKRPSVRAGVDDLHAFAGGRLTEEQMKARLQIDES